MLVLCEVILRTVETSESRPRLTSCIIPLALLSEDVKKSVTSPWLLIYFYCHLLAYVVGLKMFVHTGHTCMVPMTGTDLVCVRIADNMCRLSAPLRVC